MGRHYTQLSIEDRCELARSTRPGGARSGRSLQLWIDAPSTIARELKRNTSPPAGLPAPQYAQEQARARRWGGARLDRDAASPCAGARPPQTRLVAGADRWSAPAGRWPDHHRPRDHLSLHLRPDHAHEAGPGLAPLPPPRQVAPGLAWTPGRQCRLPHLPSAPPGGAARHRHRPPDPRAIGKPI